MWCLHISLICLCDIYTYFDLPMWCFVNRALYFNYFLYVKILLFFWTLLGKGWNISLPHRKGQSFTVTKSPILQPMMIFPDFVLQQLFVLDTGLCQAGSLCISKFTFACTCLALCSLSMTPFCIFYLRHLYLYSQSFMHIVQLLYIFAMLFLTD